MRPSSGAAAASWNAKEKGNDDERRVALKTALGGAAKPLARPEALNTALDAKPKPTGDGGAVLGGANPRPSGAVLGGSTAAQLSARRLERHGVRMELRKVSARHGALSPQRPPRRPSPIVTTTARTPVVPSTARTPLVYTTTAPTPAAPKAGGALHARAHHGVLSSTGERSQARSAEGERRWWSRCSTRRGRRRSDWLPRLTGRPPGGEAPPDAGACECARKGRLVNVVVEGRCPLAGSGVEWTLCESAERGGPGLAENTHNTATWARGARARLKKGMFSMRENKTASSCTA